MSDPIYHLALVSDWEAALTVGEYTVSSLGVTLEQEGFLHASRYDQWEGVQQRYYADVTDPLVLLVIDLDLLTSPLVVEPVGDDSYPHIYGPLNVDAVVEARPVARASSDPR
jgi:glutathione S-transferase